MPGIREFWTDGRSNLLRRLILQTISHQEPEEGRSTVPWFEPPHPRLFDALDLYPCLCVMEINTEVGPRNGLHPASREQHRSILEPVSTFHIEVA